MAEMIVTIDGPALLFLYSYSYAVGVQLIASFLKNCTESPKTVDTNIMHILNSRSVRVTGKALK